MSLIVLGLVMPSTTMSQYTVVFMGFVELLRYSSREGGNGFKASLLM